MTETLRENITGNPHLLGESDIKKLLIEYSLPAIVGMVIVSLYHIVDSIFIGHGIGLELDEMPIIAKKHQILQPGMVFALEPKFIFPGEGTVGIEDTFVLTESGLEQLTTLDDAVQIL